MQIFKLLFVFTILVPVSNALADRIACADLENSPVPCSDFPDYYSAVQSQPAKVSAQSSYANIIADQNEFNRLQRTYIVNKQKRPHVLFMVNRTTGKAYYANSTQFAYHHQFAETLGVVEQNTNIFFRKYYIEPDRKWIVGTLTFMPETEQFYWEYSDRDIITPPIYADTYSALKASFFADLKFYPNSVQQEAVRSGSPDVPAFALADVVANQSKTVYFEGRKTGILKFVDSDDLDVTSDKTWDATWDANNIVVFKEAPVYVTPLQGIITTEPSSPLAHIHLLARNWQVPDVYWRDVKYEKYVGQWVTFDANIDTVTLRPATQAEIKAVQKPSAQSMALPSADLNSKTFTALADQQASDSIRYGFKAANLGHVSQVKGVQVPRGYSVPFYYYQQFMLQNDLYALVEEIHQAKAKQRPALLAKLRTTIETGELNADFQKALLAYHRKFFADQGVFVRSSTNAEDAPGFSGAGLYTSVPNVQSDADVLLAVKKVWASVWNDRAYQARELHGIDHNRVYASVLLQRAMAAESAGVLVTKNPYNEYAEHSIFINAKRGLGIKVVNGNRVPEQIIVNRKTRETILLTRSQEATQLILDDKGGVKEVAIPNAEVAVLTQPLIDELAVIAENIETKFKGVPQDIEWLVVDDQIWIVQSRPFN